MKSLLLFWVAVLAPFVAFPQVINSSVYPANQPAVINHLGHEERTLFEGTTRDFSHLILQTITIPARLSAQPTLELDEEAILIIKTGELTLTLGDKRKVLGPGSVILIMPGDEYRIDNKATLSLTYYQMRYTSNEMPDLDLYRLMGNSSWIDWQKVVPTTDQQGNSRRMISYSTVMSDRMVIETAMYGSDPMTFQPHSHRAAEILFIQDQLVRAQLGGMLIEAKAGDVIFVESDVLHAIQPSSQAGSTYLSVQF